ncbi:MAG: DUF202 domain-containing protein [Bacteroidia bacterium]|jgi:putative membrane protein|nr:DUF202 domain-containing protein [Bacteroidia bacterium]
MSAIENKINKDLILREKLALQRTVLANQTTLLTFLKTSLYFLVAGLSLRSLLKLEDSVVLETLLFLVSVGTLVFGVWNYYKHKTLIHKSEVHIGNFKTEYLEK